MPVTASRIERDLNAFSQFGRSGPSAVTRLALSRAGHDAMYVARIAPAAMLFVPSKDGLSHNSGEFTSTEEIALGAEVLAEAVLSFR